MKLLSIRAAFSPREKLGILNLTLGGRIPVRSTEGDNESDLLLILTSFKGARSNTSQTPNQLKYI